jgi:hypothetical protein
MKSLPHLCAWAAIAAIISGSGVLMVRGDTIPKVVAGKQHLMYSPPVSSVGAWCVGTPVSPQEGAIRTADVCSRIDLVESGKDDLPNQDAVVSDRALPSRAPRLFKIKFNTLAYEPVPLFRFKTPP